jgi:hypothetical protein
MGDKTASRSDNWPSNTDKENSKNVSKTRRDCLVC